MMNVLYNDQAMAIDFKLQCTKAMPQVDTAPLSMPKQQVTRPHKSAAQGWVQGAAEKLNRIRTDEAYRQEIAARTK